MVISIDIGTSYSGLCIKNAEGKAEAVKISTGMSIYGNEYLLPSAVFVNNDGSVIVGQAAMNSRKSNPRNFRAEFKRDLGQNVPITLGDRSFMPEDLYTELFLHMKNCYEKICNEEIEKVYITHPVSFGKIKKEKIINAAKNAGFFNTVLIDEPSAAAMSYTANGTLKDGDVFLVYDFGGGTFDTALIEYKDSDFRAVGAPGGIEHCGGIDIDRAIFSHMMSKIPDEAKEKLLETPLKKMRFDSHLAELAVKIKHQLSFSTEATEIIPSGYDDIDYTLTRSEFNNMTVHLVEQTVECVRTMLSNKNMTVEDINGILLVGGTSKIPLVRERLEKFAEGIPIYSAIDPQLAVAQGALEYNGTEESEAEALIKFAESGNSDAQYKLGLYYLNCKKNECEAVRWLEKASENGNEKAYYQLGKLYAEGKGTTKDLNRALELFIRCAESENSPSLQLMIANLYADEKNDYYNAVKWYEKVADADEEKDSFEVCCARYRLGKCYYLGCGVSLDYFKAMRMFEKVAQSKDGRIRDMVHSAEYFLAECYYNGTGTDTNYQKALYWYEKASEGSEDACLKLGECYLNGQGIEKDIDRAIRLLTPVADKGNISARILLGNVYDEEKQDFYGAFKWFEDVAETNNEEYKNEITLAQYKLALYYHHGKGVDADNNRAVYWYEKAAENGNGNARTELANRYLYGIGIPKNIDKSIMYFQKAVLENDILFCCVPLIKIFSDEKNNYTSAMYWAERLADRNDSEHITAIAFAQHFLGKCYYQGLGCEKNLYKAIYWYEKATQNGEYSECCNLGVWHIKGGGVLKNVDKAITYLKMAVEKGIRTLDASSYLARIYVEEKKDCKTAAEWAEKMSSCDPGENSAMVTKTQLLLADCFFNGNGTPVDYAKAAYWFKKASTKDAYAKCMLGVCYENGYGVNKDTNNAIDLYKKSRDEGCTYAYIRLGMCFLNGVGIETNVKQSVLYFRNALEKDSTNSQAMYLLGNAYEKTGEIRNIKLAEKWYTQAAELGYGAASGKLQQMENITNAATMHLRNIVANEAVKAKIMKKKDIDAGFPKCLKIEIPDRAEHSNYVYMSVEMRNSNRYLAQINETTGEVKFVFYNISNHQIVFLADRMLIFSSSHISDISISFDKVNNVKYPIGSLEEFKKIENIEENDNGDLKFNLHSYQMFLGFHEFRYDCTYRLSSHSLYSNKHKLL